MLSLYYITVLVIAFFSSYFCMESIYLLARPPWIAVIRGIVEIAGILCGGAVVYKWDAICCARWTFVALLVGEVVMMVGLKAHNIIVAVIGLYTCSYCVNMLVISVLTIVCNWPKNASIPLQLGVLSGVRILGGLSAALLSSIPSYRPLLLYSPLLVVCVGLLFPSAEDWLQAVDSDASVKNTRTLPAHTLSGEVDGSALSSQQDDSYEASPVARLSLEDIKKPLWPLCSNPVMLVSCLCGALLTGPLLPLQGTYFDTDNWTVLPYTPQADGGSYSNNIWYDSLSGHSVCYPCVVTCHVTGDVPYYLLLDRYAYPSIMHILHPTLLP